MKKKLADHRYGYLDDNQTNRPFSWRILPLILSLLFLVGAWLYLDQKILFGDAWISETYDNIEWRTNEGNTQT